MNIAHTSAAQGTQIAAPSATPAPTPAPGFHDALATAQTAGPGSRPGAANVPGSAGKGKAGTTEGAETGQPGKKEKNHAAQGGTDDGGNGQPNMLAATLPVPPVHLNLSLPTPADPATASPQAADAQAGANTSASSSQALPAMLGVLPVEGPGSLSGEAVPMTQAASLPLLPATQAAPAAPAADMRKQPSESAGASPSSASTTKAPAALHAGLPANTAAAPAPSGDMHAFKDLSGSPMVGAHPLLAHRGELSGKAAPAGSVSAGKPSPGPNASSPSKTAGNPDSSNTGNNTGSSNTGENSGTPGGSNGPMNAPAPVPAFAAAGGVNLLGSSSPSAVPGVMLAQAVPAGTPAPATAADTGRSALPVSTAGAQEPPAAINTAQVLGRMNGTEMRVGMRSEEFGSISIQTSVSPGNVVAQIALDHGALGRALAAHLPAMEEKLGNTLGVTARVELRDGMQTSTQGSGGETAGSGTSANSGAGGGNGSAGSGTSARRALTIDSGPRFAGGEIHGSPGERLSIHA